MEEEVKEDYSRPKASIPKTIIFILLTVILIVLGVYVFSQVATDGVDETTPKVPNSNTSQTSSPDRVKENTGSTGDTNPSNDGTGGGNANTLLNQ